MSRRCGGLAFLALLAIAANLRAPLTSVPPLVDQISGALGLSGFAADFWAELKHEKLIREDAPVPA